MAIPDVNITSVNLKDVCLMLETVVDCLTGITDLICDFRADFLDLQKSASSGTPFRTSFNTRFDHNRGEVNNDPSEFIPGQAMSVSELAARLRTGQLPMIAKDPQYSDEEDIDEDLTFEDPAFDLTDVSDRLSSIATTETSEHRQSYDGDGAAASQKPQAPIDVDNSSAGSSEVGPS